MRGLNFEVAEKDIFAIMSGGGGGMNKRAGIAPAMALDPEILFLDEPGVGLDPLI
jgi:phospholipid/cholesterol/gamma-HCH transport system ATP-binding protein